MMKCIINSIHNKRSTKLWLVIEHFEQTVKDDF